MQCWCTRELRQSLVDGGEYTHAYRDVLTGVGFAPAKCREVREGLIRIAVEEVRV